MNTTRPLTPRRTSRRCLRGPQGRPRGATNQIVPVSEQFRPHGAAIQRICRPGPKTEVPDWYRRSVLHSLWGFPPERFTSQAFWDCFDQIRTAGADPAAGQDDLEQAQLRLESVKK